ncbi:hypothetical protein KC717_01295 [Candidatus Dojkabacteria bacterium]|uniref:Uncharacterized protein n=1 Tax=Candidatus Dojkabacteria bacterium TaxID=2099670 RepID=A0A955L7Y4_9BACT|nr:hypothetical protein [Candidatus Dojkabacteria bacterium]
MLYKIKNIFNITVFTIVLLYFVQFVFLHHVAAGNWVETHTRPYLIQSDFLRYLFFLNGSGDGRYELLGSSTDEILIELDYQAGFEPELFIEEALARSVREATGKSAKIIVDEDPDIPSFESFVNRQLEITFSETEDEVPSSDQVYIHVLYLSSSTNEEYLMGQTFSANKMVIYKSALNEVNKSSEIRKKLEESMFKYNLGELLGLPLINRDGCVMHQYTPIASFEKVDGKNIATEYCVESLVKLEAYQKKAGR